MAEKKMSFIEGLYKELGESDLHQDVKDYLSVGFLPLNKALSGKYSGGLPVGRIIEIFGKESCLAADTFIPYLITTPEGQSQNAKGGTIDRLYERFHDIPRKGQGNYQRGNTVNSLYRLVSADDDGFIVGNEIADVVKTGVQECFKVTTKGGLSIKATANHKFSVGLGYRRLAGLKVGDTVYVHVNTPNRADSPHGNGTRPTWMVKHHPFAPEKVVEGKYVYKRLQLSRAMYEAYMNTLTPEEYRHRLNSGNMEGLKFLQPDVHVHHIDEDFSNNSKENLAVMTATDHGKLHGTERVRNLSFITTPDTIAAIESVGLQETYDIKMADPFRNYVANKFVVHNCGKTLLATMACIETQKKGGLAVWLDYEHAFALSFGMRLGLKNDRAQWVYKQPDTAEAGFKAIDFIVKLARKEAVEQPITIIADSVSAMVTEYEMSLGAGNNNMKSNLALPAVMSSELKKLAGLISGTNVTIIFLNQTRENPGVMFGNKEKTSGGNALKFYCSVRVQLRKNGTVKEGDAEDSVVIGEKVKATVIKNKVYMPFETAKYTTSLIKGGINLEMSHVEALVEADLIEKSGAWYAYDGKKIQGRDKLLEIFADPKEYAKMLSLFKD